MSRRKKRILIVVGSVLVVGVVYLSLFGLQTGLALMARYQYRRVPEVAKTPIALPDSSVSDTPHKKITHLGYEVELPWDDVDDQKSKIAGPICLTAFHSGNAFWFSKFPPKEFVNHVLQTPNLDPQTVRQAYGDDAFESDYSFMSKMLQVTPKGIRPLGPRREAVAGALLLVIKALSMPKADSGIFSIKVTDFKGFQFGNPPSRPYRITDELYSDDGGIDLIFYQKVGGSETSISQAEINRVIQSIHKVPTQVLESNANRH
jgi:hypothetical protein